ncbi:MAG: zinc-binding dehydrogenase [Chloroflexi bacterium]|nr:zinc-binding dehydrogenase [Chloroflexota bacterium]
MRCAVWMGGNGFRVEERPTTAPGPGEVRVRLHACGVCLTEVHMTEGRLPQPEPPPRILGHEWSGTVAAVGPAITGFDVGAPVAGLGVGGFAEEVVVPAGRLFALPAGIPLDAACFVEPLACCVAAVAAAGLGERPPAPTALVTGAGPMGLMVAQLAGAAGARVLVSEPIAARRELARRLGAVAVVDPTRERLADAVAALTGGAGVDVALETAGRPAPLADCLDALREGGVAVMVGVNSTEARLELPIYRFHRRNLTLRGSYGARGDDDISAAIAWLGRLDLVSLVSHRFGLSDIALAFDTARSGQGIKTLVTCRA